MAKKRSSKKTSRTSSRSVTKPRRMARKRRNFALPSWTAIGALLVLTVGLAVWVWRPARTYETPPPYEGDPPGWIAGPEDVTAYADTLASQAARTLVGLGVPRDAIRTVRLPENRGSHMRWEVRAGVPEDLPLAVCNLALTRLARRIGGDVLEGREGRTGRLLSLRAGLGEKSTNLITLKVNPDLVRLTGRIAIVVDDFGYQDPALIARFCRIPQPITLSIFPDEERTLWTAQQAMASGKGVMVHLPMEPIDYPARNPGPNAIFTDFAPERIRDLTRQGLLSVPGAQGMNNHMGSRVTEDSEAIGAVLAEVKRQGVFFLDSMTSRQSVAYSVAQAAGVPSARNAMFLDRNEAVEAVERKLYALSERARIEGTVIGIGHAKPGTLKALERVLPELVAQGFEFVLAQEAVQ